MFLVGELGISVVKEHGRMGEVSQVTHPNINDLIMHGLVRGGRAQRDKRGDDSMA